MKRLSRIAWTVAVLFLLLAPFHALAGSHETLTPLLVDLAGWTAEEATGMDMDMNGMKMVTANRSYTKDDKRFEAAVMVGSNQMSQSQLPDVNAETPESRYSTKEIDGFTVHQGFEKIEKTGTIMIHLASVGTEGGAALVISFEGISDEEGLDLAKKFDWKKMKSGAESLLNR